MKREALLGYMHNENMEMMNTATDEVVGSYQDTFRIEDEMIYILEGCRLHIHLVSATEWSQQLHDVLDICPVQVGDLGLRMHLTPMMSHDSLSLLSRSVVNSNLQTMQTLVDQAVADLSEYTERMFVVSCSHITRLLSDYLAMDVYPLEPDMARATSTFMLCLTPGYMTHPGRDLIRQRYSYSDIYYGFGWLK